MNKFTIIKETIQVCLLIALVVLAFRMAGQVIEVRRCLNHIEEIMISRNLKVHDHQPAPLWEPPPPDVYSYQPLEPHKPPHEKKK